MLADGDAEGAGLFLQQSLEKFLKAYLLGKGWKLKKVHTLCHSVVSARESLLFTWLNVIPHWAGPAWNWMR